MDPTRRLVLHLSAAAGTGVLASRAGAQPATDFPTRSVRMLVPFPVGGAADIVARLLAADMGATLRQSVVVENRVGASGNIALEATARAPADGYTVVLGSASIAINPFLIKATAYDPRKDFTPIAMVAMVPSALLVSGSLGVNTLAELIALARSKPGEIAYGSNGVGTTQHLAAVMFAQRAGITLNHVPYKGADALMPDLVAGRIQMSFNNVASAQPFLKSGAIKALAVGLPKRYPTLPEVPTFEEAGLTRLDVSSWVALFGPAGLPAPVLRRLEEAVLVAMRKPEIREKVLGGGNDPVVGGSADLAKFLDQELAHWKRAIDLSGATPS